MIMLLVTLALIALVAWAIVTFIPMPEALKKIIIGVAAVAILLYVIQAFGISDIPVPRLR